jgi:hypothetical protein
MLRTYSLGRDVQFEDVTESRALLSLVGPAARRSCSGTSRSAAWDPPASPPASARSRSRSFAARRSPARPSRLAAQRQRWPVYRLRVGRTLTLRLAPFEREALDAYVTSQRIPVERVVRTALLYYLQERHLTRSTWPMPTLPGDEPAPAIALEIELGDDTERAVAEHAAAQGVQPEDLARHAVLFFLADVDSGRVAETLERALRGD